MQSILTTYTNQDGVAFPNTGAIDSSGPLATDGTEFIAAFVEDYAWGIMQALLDYVGDTPNGTVESPSNSQYLDSHRKAFSYPGQMIAAAWNDDPATLGIRAIKLIGQGIVRANYPLLDAAVYVGDANNAAVAAAGGAFFRADNSDGSSPNTTGAYLILPDMRGQTIRGLDTAAAVDPDGASRYLGDVQPDAFQGHYHLVRTKPAGTDNSYPAEGQSAGTTNSGATAAYTIVTDGVNGTPRISSETRMTNVSWDIYIRF